MRRITRAGQIMGLERKTFILDTGTNLTYYRERFYISKLKGKMSERTGKNGKSGKLGAVCMYF